MNVVPVTHSEFKDRRFVSPVSLLFAARDTIVPLGFSELGPILMEMPLAFVQHKDVFLPVGVLGLGSQRNLFVSAAGGWTGQYLPAVYRSYPFSLHPTEDGERILCIDCDSQRGEGSQGSPFFTFDGHPLAWVESVLQFLSEIDSDRKIAERKCTQLQSMGLLEPLSVSVESKGSPRQLRLNGLFSVNQQSYLKLAPSEIREIHNQGLLALVHAQMLSLHQFHRLSERAKTNAPGATNSINLDMWESPDITFDWIDRDDMRR